MTTEEKGKKPVYEKEIITLKETYENPLDMSKIPVFNLENCEVLYSSLSSNQAKFGHNIQILLPVGTDFPQTDRAIRQNYLKAQQRENPNLEVVKGIVKAITDKDILNGKYPEKYSGRYYLDIRISNTCMFDKTPGEEEGKFNFKKIDKAEDAIGVPVIKYFRVIDKFTGEGVEPEIFKYVNGEKVTSFISPKTKQETPLYLNSGDTINITIRPFGSKNNNTGDFALKYNLLKVEIVQTAWDKGIGRTGGGSKIVHEAPESVNAEDLADIFGGISTVENTSKKEVKAEVKTETKAKPKPEPVEEKATVKEEPKVETTETPEIDFSALANMDMSSLNLGE